jgi:hypothetical protein
MSRKDDKNSVESLEQMMGKLITATPRLANVISNLSQKADDLEQRVLQATAADWHELERDHTSRTIH